MNFNLYLRLHIINKSILDQEPSDGCQQDSVCENEYICNDLKLMESEYEEIRDIPTENMDSPSAIKSQWKEKQDFIERNSDLCQSDNSFFLKNVTAHAGPEPSAPLLETLSEKYVESSLVRNSTEFSEDKSKSVQCTDDIDYIAISKSENDNSGCSCRLPHIETEPNDTDSSDIPVCKEEERLPFQDSDHSRTDSMVLSTHHVDYSNVSDSESQPCTKRMNSYEQLDPSRVEADERPYEALKSKDSEQNAQTQ